MHREGEGEAKRQLRGDSLVLHECSHTLRDEVKEDFLCGLLGFVVYDHLFVHLGHFAVVQTYIETKKALR